MIRITYECETVEQAVQFLRGAIPDADTVAKQRATFAKAQKEAPPVVASTPIGSAIIAPGATGTGSAAAPTPLAAMKEPNKPVTVQPAPPPQPVGVSDVDVRNALREVFNAKGAKIATELLKQFGAARVSDIKPEQYINFIEACAT